LIIYEARRQLIKYFIVGLISVVLDIYSLVLIKEALAINPVAAVALNQLLIIFFNFALNKYWSFGNRNLPYRQFVRYLILTAFDYGFGILTMYLFHQLLGLNYLIVRLATIAVMVSWNFLLYKFWIYRHE
jgi:putative flippase GtrA